MIIWKNGITKSDSYIKIRQKAAIKKLSQRAKEVYYKLCQVLQSVTGCYNKVRQVLQSVSIITK